MNPTFLNYHASNLATFVVTCYNTIQHHTVQHKQITELNSEQWRTLRKWNASAVNGRNSLNVSDLTGRNPMRLADILLTCFEYS